MCNVLIGCSETRTVSARPVLNACIRSARSNWSVRQLQFSSVEFMCCEQALVPNDCCYYVPPPPYEGDTKRYSDPSVCLPVCLSHSAAAVGYRHIGCLQLSSVRTADPSADGRRSAASQTAIGGGHIVSPPPGR